MRLFIGFRFVGFLRAFFFLSFFSVTGGEKNEMIKFARRMAAHQNKSWTWIGGDWFRVERMTRPAVLQTVSINKV